MFEKLKKWLLDEPELPPPPPPEPEPAPAPKKPRAPRKPRPKPKPELTAKEKATLAGEPYVAILSVALDPKDINNGSFELDWNDKFLINLVKQGYKFSVKDTDSQIIDRWFQNVCRNIAMEVYDQEIADPEKRDESDVRIIRQRDIGDGFTEVS